ncbi:sulfurtransferase [Pseudactinotalea sp. HY160]|uniref:sulfurtransferase n=1 Tax=Pseudactinotalea sp. HY160 TaxID=2654490 RepID=UPI00128C5A69|nr:rhodanese-like domain-containing protein [Pseudactinotalea sp. HY160]MPV50768.1 sulfurtransferase [Pseudactinotalea sp. HY160]
MRDQVFVTAEALAGELRGTRPPVLLDVRWALGEPDGYAAYRAGHLPGAAYVDLETQLADPADPRRGRHPLPTLERLQEAARFWGVNDGDAVVCYDDSGGAAAARAWWLLRWAGMTDVRILDGGLRAWSGHGALEVFEPKVREIAREHKSRRGTVTFTAEHLPVLTADEVDAFDGVLIDARAAARYRGDVEPLDPRAGHIPGAVNVPYTENLRPDGGLRRVDELARSYVAAGVPVPSTLRLPAVDLPVGWRPRLWSDAADAPKVGVYCGSGVTATHDIAVLASLGVEAALYPGSWSQWSADSARPVATGTHAPAARATTLNG